MNLRPKITLQDRTKEVHAKRYPLRCRSLDTCMLNPRPKIYGAEKTVSVEKVAYTGPKPRSRWQQRSKTDSCMNKSQNAKSHSIPLPKFKMEGVDVNSARNENK